MREPSFRLYSCFSSAFTIAIDAEYYHLDAMTNTFFCAIVLTLLCLAAGGACSSAPAAKKKRFDRWIWKRLAAVQSDVERQSRPVDLQWAESRDGMSASSASAGR
jgi:hypothetical protein